MKRGDEQTRSVLKPLVRQKFEERIEELQDQVWMETLKMNNEWLFVGLVFLLCLIGSCSLAHAQSDEQICGAIFRAENSQKYPYGIRSVSCGTLSECKVVCENTVRNNRKRFTQYGYKTHREFISFLASRYAPVKGRITQAEKRLNGNWERNVRYFLARSK